MTGRITTPIRRLIGRNRKSVAVKTLHAAASFVESAHINEGSSFDLNGEKRIVERLRAADFRVAFDVGANDGDWLTAALANWPRCHVHAFEAAPPTFQRLLERVSASGHRPRTTLNCLGRSDQNGSHEMFYYPEHPELTCDLPRHNTFQVTRFEARLCTRDFYAARNGRSSLRRFRRSLPIAEVRNLSIFRRGPKASVSSSQIMHKTEPLYVSESSPA